MISTARVSIGFVYMMEFIPKENHAFLCTFFMIQVPFITLLATVYFVYISKHWFWFCSIGVVMLVFVDVFSLWLPESPKYLLKTGKTSEAK
jgi:MFS family permease